MPEPLNPPFRFWLAAEAHARRIDRDRALLGALGVASDPLPHQLHTVRRMLTGVGGRWLLADEVGLGKTVQALMLMRGLSAQAARPLRVSVVVPDDLFRQWETELATRADALALESMDAPVRLHTPARFQNEDAPRLRDADLLIIDEWPRLTQALKDAVRAAARLVPDVLVISATPDLQDEDERRELMALLEPELERQAAAGDTDLLQLLDVRDAAGAQALSAEDWSAWTEPPPDLDRREATADAFGAYRRVIRSRRRDYPGLMPTRRYAPIRAEPTEGDAVRAEVAREALAIARVLEIDVRNDLLLQLAGRSPETLERGLSNVSRKSRELRAQLIPPRSRIPTEPGDARLDALLDDLLRLRRKAPDTRVLVVAEDTPTVTYLADEVGRMLDVTVARMERLPGGGDLEVQAVEQRKRLQPFIDGDAPVLVAASSAKEGHNLQSADRIYFYALPWSPQDVEQWIGRIDRLGGPEAVRGVARTVEVTPLIVEGSVEDRIVSVLEAAGVFEQSALYEGELGEALAEAIERAAYNAAAADWEGLLRRARAAADRRNADERLPTAFPPTNRAGEALALFDRLREAPYAGALRDGSDGFEAREQAIERLLQRLQAFQQLDIWRGRRDAHDPAVRFSTVWYKGAPQPGDVLVPEIEVEGPGKRRAFLHRRRQLASPPAGQVLQYVDSRPLKLDFLDHGNRLHDSLVEAYNVWSPPGRPEQHCVEFPEGHPVLTTPFTGCDVLLETGELKLAGAFTYDRASLVADIPLGSTQLDRDAVDRADARALQAFQQDRRWLLDLCPPAQLRAAAVLTTRGSAAITPDAWFEPLHGEAAPRWVKTMLYTPPKLAGLHALTHAVLHRAADTARGEQVDAVAEALPRRLFLVGAEMDAAVATARAELARAERSTQARALAQAGTRAARLALELAERSRTIRLERLRVLPTTLAAASHTLVGHLILRPLPPSV